MVAAKQKASVSIKRIAPQFLVDDLDEAIAYYSDKLGFEVEFVYENFYAAVSRDGASIHLKCASKTESDRAHRRTNEHLDAFIDVANVDALFDEIVSANGLVTKALGDRPWQCRDFYVEDIDGYILCFSQNTA